MATGVKTVRVMNRAAVMNLIRDQGPISRPQIAKQLNLSLATVQRVVDDLIKEDLVHLEKEPDRQVGRPSDKLYFNGDAYTVAGIDLGMPIMSGVLSSLSGTITFEHNIRFTKGEGEANFEKLCEMIRALEEESLRLNRPIKAIGLGIPGIIDHENGIVNRSSDLGWENVNVVQQLSGQFNIPVFIERDMNLVALGELGFGAGRGVRNFACISLGTYMKAALVMDGKLYRGQHHCAGKFGHMLPGIDSLAYRDDQHHLGALAEFASGTHVMRRAKEILQAQGKNVLAENITTCEIYEAARDGQDWAQPIIRDAIQYIAWAVANLTVLFDPEMIIISGKVSNMAEFIVEPVLSLIGNSIPWKPKLRVSNLGDYSTVFGAIRMIYQTSFSF